ncbi:hypothetical protein SteCoe_21567 [Stentor coeruleus]|uniref:Probable imidazolonepropionase n=1 Tax=Stentor coeruleus TaxID=5963 RepID=A0A1R2BPC1_9CILI|nr:hypothetical protein SteCoe_21567 [Stentor coeruleus]
MYTLLYNIGEIVQISISKEPFKTQSLMRDLHILNNGAIVIKDSEIFDIGFNDEIQTKYANTVFSYKFDVKGNSVVPGLVDAHTHPVFAGDRVHEFAMKLDGKTYMDIHKAGGGIMYSVNCVKNANESTLYESLNQRLNKFLKSGTTLVECKSGYGIDTENEIKMMKVIKRAQDHMKISIVSTYLPAHTIPPGMTENEMANLICDEEIPIVKKMIEQGEINPEQIDVFCEKNIYELESTERILRAGKSIGLEGNFHGEELNCLNSCVMGGNLGVRSISHLEYTSDEDIAAMRDSKVCAVLLPSTQYILHLPIPPVRKMIDEGVIVALGSDFNPNAWCYDMKFIMNLACVNYRMNMPEALVAATLNAAASIGRSHLYGSIEIGKKADLLVLNCANWEHIIYEICDSPISLIFKHGELVHDFSN